MTSQIKKENHGVFSCLVTLLILLLFTRYSFNVDIPRAVLTSVVIAIAVIGTKDEILAISLCCIPLHEAIDFYVALIACAVMLIAKNPRLMKSKVFIILGLFVVFWELLHCVSIDFSFVSLIIAIVPMAFLIIVLSFDISEIDYPFIVRSLAVMSAAHCTVVLLNYIVQSDFDFIEAVLNLQRLGLINTDDALLGGRINPNSLGVINVLVVTGLFQLRSLNRQRKVDYILSTVLVVFGVLTASRTFLICLLIMFILLIMGQKGNIRKKISFIVVLIGSIGVAWLLLNWLFPSVLEYFIGRFQVADITTGRDMLMLRYHNYIVNNIWVLFFGIGSTELSHKAVNVYQITNNGPHNSIQEIVLAWGIPGLLIIGLLVFIMFTESKRYSKKKILLNFIPLIIIFAKSMAGQLLTSGYTMLAMAFAYLSLCQDFTDKKFSDEKDCNLVTNNTEI